jgi:hypothetical protein
MNCCPLLTKWTTKVKEATMGKTTGHRRRKHRRLNLWRKNPYCHWCGKKLKWKQTTLDHINQRVKVETRPRFGQTVLSCNKCNQQRAIKVENEMTLIQKWLRGSTPPRLRRAFIYYPGRPLSFKARISLIYFHLIKNRLTC